MKTLITLICILLISLASFAQGYGINYKAVIKDGSGNILANQNLKVKFAILDLSDNVDYGATHTTTTDANGIIILNIGSGTEDVIGDYFALDWVNGFYRLRVEIDIAPYDTFVPLGTTPFQAVPLALSSLDNLWQFNNDNAIALAEKVGIGTGAPTELLHIYDEDKAAINLEVPSFADQSQIEFRNGSETGAHTFYKLSNESDIFKIAIDTDFGSTTTGYEDKLSININGLQLENGTRINEISSDATLGGNSDTAVPTEQAVKTYVDATTSPAYTIGLSTEQGGYIFWVSIDGKHGLVAATFDQSTNSNWYAAQDFISNPSNHSVDGGNFRDWRLPTKFELNEMYLQRNDIGGFSTGNYWSSTENDSTFAWRINFFIGDPFSAGKSLNSNVRAIRAF